MYPAFISLSNIDKGIKIVTNKISDKLSPRKIPLFIFKSPSVSLADVNSYSQFFVDFSVTCLILLTILKILRHSECRYEELCHRLSDLVSRQHQSLSFFSEVFSLSFYLSLTDLGFH